MKNLLLKLDIAVSVIGCCQALKPKMMNPITTFLSTLLFCDLHQKRVFSEEGSELCTEST